MNPNSLHPSLRIHLFGDPSANPEEVAPVFGGEVLEKAAEECDLALFLINPSLGIDAKTISNWETLNESMPPRMVLVTGIENQEADFDDAVLLANRVFDLTVTPYLVLHDDQGDPCALISLSDLKIRDYSTIPPTISESDPEHKTLVSEFRSEYLAAIDVMGEDGFAAGMMFPAIPIWIEKGIGIDIVKSYIAKLEQ
ncbi:MAG: hypothetical protein HY050_07630 [Actinobacteria bacterium]|nr:hypothetical protein [Actinomycetota bacterium]